jgi:hypothetical protein
MASILQFDQWQSASGVSKAPVINAYQAFNNTTYSVGGTSAYDMPNMTITVTPTTSSSRFILNFNCIGSYSGNATSVFWFQRNGIDLRTMSGYSYNGQAGCIFPGTDRTSSCNATFIDLPGTAAAITYNVRMATDGTSFIGRRSSDTYIGVPQYFQILELAA